MIRIFTSKAQRSGEAGEDAAVSFLKKKGFSIVERNAANKFGELDIVARKGGVHYFFEVKAGKQGAAVNPSENLTAAKLRKFFVSIEHYCMIHRIRDWRAEGIIVLQKPDGTYTVETIALS